MSVKLLAELGHLLSQPFQFRVSVFVAGQPLKVVHFLFELFQLSLPRGGHFFRRFLFFFNGHSFP